MQRRAKQNQALRELPMCLFLQQVHEILYKLKDLTRGWLYRKRKLYLSKLP